VSITSLRKWDVTPIEIALDLEMPQSFDPTRFGFSGPAEPRICLVAAFAITPQLKRIVTAVDRAAPSRLPSALRVAPAKLRSPTKSSSRAISIQPMLALIRLQSRLIRAIDPGLAGDGVRMSFEKSSEMDEAAAHFVGEFIPSKTLPTFEPSGAVAEFVSAELRAVGITVYRLGRHGTPQSILGHWSYARRAGSSVHLEGGP
jgi:hypothetical protein